MNLYDKLTLLWVTPISIIITIAAASSVRAGAVTSLPVGVDCQIINGYVAQHGKAKAIAFAIKNGATWLQLREASKCLK